MFTIVYFIFYRSVYIGDIPCATAMTLAVFSRFLCGTLTTLPIPHTAQLNDNELPTMIVGNNFFLFFSGHTCNCEVGRMILKHEGRKTLSKVIRLLNFLQSIRLISTRGHYSIDIIAGYVFAFPIYATYVWARERVKIKSRGKIVKTPEGAKRDWCWGSKDFLLWRVKTDSFFSRSRNWHFGFLCRWFSRCCFF